MGAGVAVAADDGHARLGESKFGADYVDNALLGRIHVKKPDAEGAAVLLQRFNLLFSDGIENRRTTRLCRNVVVNCGEGAQRLTNFASGHTKPFKRLWRRHLVDEVQIHVQERLLPVWR